MQHPGEEQFSLSTIFRLAVSTLTGTTFALLSASLVCRSPEPSGSSGVLLLLRAAGYSVLVAVAGFSGLWLGLPHKHQRVAVRLSGLFLAGWLFLPAAVLLVREYSTLALVPAALAGNALSLAWLRAFPTRAVEASAWPAARRAELFTAPSTESFHFGTSLIVSLLVYFIAVLLWSGWLSLAGYLVTLTTFLLTRPLAEPVIYADLRQPFGSRRSLPLVCLSTLAICMTIAALLPTLRAEIFTRNLAVLQLWMANMRLTRAQQATVHDKAASSPGYIGVVLWPPPRKKLEAIAPFSKPAMDTPALRRPMVILFNGPYLYSKTAGELPGPLSHVAHGTPLSARIASSDQNPIYMQAHQHLDRTLNPDCCSAIEIAFDNKESAGSVEVGLVLTDTASSSAPTEYLGLRTLQADQQSIKFPLSDRKKLRPFDDLRVLVLEPVGPRARAGAKVAIDHFTLLPR
jgi:hypothetical protein